MENTNTFPSILRSLRIKKGYTQQQLAKYARVSQTAIYQWEKGIRKPKIRQLEKLAYVLDISIKDLDPELKSYELSIEDANRMYYEKEKNATKPPIIYMPNFEKRLLQSFNILNDTGKEEAVKRVAELTEIKKYQRSSDPDNTGQ